MTRRSAAESIELERTERYVLHDEIAHGGMAAVHLGMLHGAFGFSRVVAIKRLHGALGTDPRFITMLIDEARLVSRIRHVNVVPTLDILQRGSEVFVIMEYVRGASLARLVELGWAADALVPLRVAVGILAGALRGLGAAHGAMDLDGSRLEVVHRDVSPQNILVGAGGIPRVIDFGVAHAVGRLTTTRSGEFKGKLAYAAPEQLAGDHATHRADIFASGVILWELVTGRRLFRRETDVATFRAALDRVVPSPLSVLEEDPRVQAARSREEIAALTPTIQRALESDPSARFDSADDMANSLERALGGASAPEIGAWVQSLAGEQLAREAGLVARAESMLSQRMDTAHRRGLAERASFTREVNTSTLVDRVTTDELGAEGSQPPPAVGPGRLAIVALAAAFGGAAGSAFVASMLRQ